MYICVYIWMQMCFYMYIYICVCMLFMFCVCACLCACVCACACVNERNGSSSGKGDEQPNSRRPRPPAGGPLPAERHSRYTHASQQTFICARTYTYMHIHMRASKHMWGNAISFTNYYNYICAAHTHARVYMMIKPCTSSLSYTRTSPEHTRNTLKQRNKNITEHTHTLTRIK